MDFNIGHVNEKDRTSPERFKDIYKQREQIIGIEKCFPKTGPRTIYGPPKLINWSVVIFLVSKNVLFD